MLFMDHGKGGTAEVLKPAEGPVPQPQTGEVVIEVRYAGVNRPDLLQRSGSYPPPPGASPILGLEVAGRVSAVAPDVTQWKTGDLVCALTPGGGYAEYCAVPAPHCLSVPKGLSLQEAAALPENFYTVWTNVFDRGHLKAGETFLVHGGSSGIGLTAIQLAKAFGATVYTTVGNAQKAEFCRNIGADAAINYREQEFVVEIAQLTNKRGVDLILDMVGGPYIENNLKSLALEGRLVQIAFLQGSKAALDFLPIMIKRITVTGSTLRPRTVAQKSAIAQDLRKQVWPLLESGKVRPVIHATFPLKDAKLAHELMESSKHIGKIMLEVKTS
ncbi:MAG: NAD(P)H-quinone oxidoreductase [Betaproteobacteria bacterium]|nr:MAG: NAD(P)H-quinone oxidoreductase [Betaproteobacteria bacterium]